MGEILNNKRSAKLLLLRHCWCVYCCFERNIYRLYRVNIGGLFLKQSYKFGLLKVRLTLQLCQSNILRSGLH